MTDYNIACDIPKQCPFCSDAYNFIYHTGPCSRVKVIEYYQNGEVKQVEFFDNDWIKQLIVTTSITGWRVIGGL
jgi:hypothetical protein